MPLFDAYVMMDWSGGNGRRAGKQDCIWIAHGLATVAAPGTVSPGSRSEAERIIRSLLQPFVRPTGGRVLVCADFAYGFPAGFASLLRGSHNGTLPAWRVVWQYLRKHLKDDLGTRPGGQPTNQSNRFEVANVINAGCARPALPPARSGASSKREVIRACHRKNLRSLSRAPAERSSSCASRT